ncbi:MAG: V-type ATPase subunit [Promethearchaeota archaeon]
MPLQEIQDNYAYVLVKLAAARSRILTWPQLKSLIEARNLPEFNSIISSFNLDLPSELIARSQDFEKAFYHSFFNSFREIIKNAPSECIDVIEKYMMKYEIENLKNLIIGKLVDIDANVIRDRLYFELEELLKTEKIIKFALDAKTIEEVIYLFRNTPYHRILHEIENRYRALNEIFFLYSLLDKYFIDSFNSILKFQRGSWPATRKQLIRNFVGIETDYYNLSTIFRGLNHNFSWEEIEIIISNKNAFFQVKLQDLKDIFHAKGDIEATMKILYKIASRYRFGSNLIQILDESMIVHSLKIFFYNLKLKLTKLFKMNDENELSNLLEFIIREEAEIENLVMIFEGIKYDFDRDLLRKFLIKEV